MHLQICFATELSKYIWSLKDSFIPYSLSWKIIAHANSYSNTTKRCNLCLTEKFFYHMQTKFMFA